jgi:hypothetical protein
MRRMGLILLSFLLLLFLLFLETGFHCVAQAGLKFLGSNNPPALDSQVAGTTGTQDLQDFLGFVCLFL